jgi:hypothetical protein
MSIQNFKCKVAEIGMTVNGKTSISYESVVEHLKKMDLDEHTLEILSKKARTLPPGSLEHFINNIQTYIIANKK